MLEIFLVTGLAACPPPLGSGPSVPPLATIIYHAPPAAPAYPTTSTTTTATTTPTETLATAHICCHDLLLLLLPLLRNELQLSEGTRNRLLSALKHEGNRWLQEANGMAEQFQLHTLSGDSETGALLREAAAKKGCLQEGSSR